MPWSGPFSGIFGPVTHIGVSEDVNQCLLARTHEFFSFAGSGGGHCGSPIDLKVDGSSLAPTNMSFRNTQTIAPNSGLHGSNPPIGVLVCV